MLTNLTSSRFRRGALFSLGLTGLWIILAFIRDGTTYHLAPALVAAVVPVVFAFETEDASVRDLGLATFGGLAIALLGTLILAIAGVMTGPSLLPFGGAVTESVVFAAGGAVAGFAIGMVRLRN